MNALTEPLVQLGVAGIFLALLVRLVWFMLRREWARMDALIVENNRLNALIQSNQEAFIPAMLASARAIESCQDLLRPRKVV